jgi:hypothetical protein
LRAAWAKVSEALSQKQSRHGGMVHAYNPIYSGGEVERSQSEAGPPKKSTRPYIKTNITSGGMA